MMSVYYYCIDPTRDKYKRLVVSSSQSNIEKSRNIALESHAEVTGIKMLGDPVGVIKLK